jgi:hypothetical protein
MTKQLAFEQSLRMAAQFTAMILFNESFAATNEREGSEDCHADSIRLVEQVRQVDLCHPPV